MKSSKQNQKTNMIAVNIPSTNSHSVSVSEDFMAEAQSRPICNMKDIEILKLKKEYRELQERYYAMRDKYIVLLEEKHGISRQEPSKKPLLRVVR